MRRNGPERGAVSETQYWFERVQAIQMVLETGEEEKARLARSIDVFDKQIAKLATDILTLTALVDK
jgi:hypothetical protein